MISLKHIALLAFLAHHAFGSVYDSNRFVRAKGVVVLYAEMNPHSLIFVDSTDANGVVEHFALETAMPQQMKRYFGSGIKPGSTIEFCGYATKDGVSPTKSYQSPEPISLSLKSIPRPIYTGKLIAPEMYVLEGGGTFGRATNPKCQ